MQMSTHITNPIISNYISRLNDYIAYNLTPLTFKKRESTQHTILSKLKEIIKNRTKKTRYGDEKIVTETIENNRQMKNGNWKEIKETLKRFYVDLYRSTVLELPPRPAYRNARTHRRLNIYLEIYINIVVELIKK